MPTTGRARHRELARERDRLKLLLEVNNAVVSHLALDELLHTISESLRQVVPHDVSALGVYDAETGQLRAQVLEYPGELPFFARGTAIPMEGTTGGLASIPLIAHGRKLGVLGVASMRENAFSEEDMELLCELAKQIAIAVDNSLNCENARDAERELARTHDQLHLLLEVTNGVTSRLDLRELFKAISDYFDSVTMAPPPEN